MLNQIPASNVEKREMKMKHQFYLYDTMHIKKTLPTRSNFPLLQDSLRREKQVMHDLNYIGIKKCLKAYCTVSSKSQTSIYAKSMKAVGQKKARPNLSR